MNDNTARQFERLIGNNFIQCEINYVELHLGDESTGWPVQYKRLQNRWRKLIHELVLPSANYYLGKNWGSRERTMTDKEEERWKEEMRPIVAQMVEQLSIYNPIYADCYDYGLKHGFKFKNTKEVIPESIQFLKAVEETLRVSLKDGTFLDHV